MMAFNYMNSSCSGRYPYCTPMHLIQQIDLSAMHVSPSGDLSNFINNSNFSHYNSVSQQVRPPAVEVSNGCSNSMKNTISDLASLHRPASEFCMPQSSSSSSIVPALPMHGDRGQYRPSQLHAQSKVYDQPYLLQEGCEPGETVSKVSDISATFCNGGQEYSNHEAVVDCSFDPSESPNSKKDAKNEKDKKFKRVRYVKPGCSNDCQRRCKQKISQNTREDLFNEFWNAENDALRKEFIARHANKLSMMTRQEGSRRSFSVDWAFNIKGESFSVCKLFFLDTLDVSEEMAYSAMKESQYFNLDNCLTQKKKTKRRKATWYETDIDDYSERKASQCLQRRPRCESKKEKITELRSGCTDACRRNCQSKFTREERLSIFNGYRSLINVRRQREFIMEHVQKLERKYVRSDKVTRRGCSIGWMLPVKGKKVSVCKTFFLHTVGISEHTAYSIGMQNEMQPAVRNKTSRQDQHPSWNTMKAKYLKALIAKGKLKSTLKLLLKASKVVVAGEKDTHLVNRLASESSKEENSANGIPFQSFSLPPPCGLNVKPSVLHSNVPLNPSHLTGLPSQGENESIFSNERLDINLPAPLYSQHHQSDCASGDSYGYFHQQPTHPGCGPAFAHTNLHSTGLSMSCDKQNSQDALLLHTLKRTTSDLFPVSTRKESNLSLEQDVPLGHEKLKKSSSRKVKEKKPFNKQIKEGCTGSCRRKCNQIIPQSVREELFEEFWSLESDVCRREYILPIVNKIPKKRNKNSDSRRGCTIEWTVPVNGELHIVCKKFFLDTFDISENFVKTVHDKIERNDGSMEDMRGKHGKRSSLFIKEEMEIEKYIRSVATYKAVRCIRCNSDFPRWCFETSTCSSQFYKNYADERKQKGAKPACRTSFTNFCTKTFNIRPGNPQEYVCDQCIHVSQVPRMTLTSTST